MIGNTAAFRSDRMPWLLKVARTPSLGQFLIRGFNAFAGLTPTLGAARPGRLNSLAREGIVLPYDSWAHRIATYRFVADIPLDESHPSYSTLVEVEENLQHLSALPSLFLWGEKDWVFTPHFLARFLEFFPEGKALSYPRLWTSSHRRGTRAGDPGKSRPPFLEHCRDLSRDSRPTRFPASSDRQDAGVYLRRAVPGSGPSNQSLLESWDLSRVQLVSCLLRNSAEFVAAVFALFKVGVIPVLVDPGMGLARFLKVIEELEPQALVGIPRAFALRKFSPKTFRKVEKMACWGHFPEIPDLRQGKANSQVPVEQVGSSDTAAVLFTSGSTGPAKGVVYTHEIFCRQIGVLRDVYNFGSQDVDLPGFPLFGLFTAALGVTGVVPALDPSRPAHCKPKALIDQIHKYGVTSLQGSPAIWKRVARECLRRRLTLDNINRLITFGAPIPFDFIENWRRVAPNAKIHTPYGATEALPVTDIEAQEILETKQGAQS